MDAAAQRFLAHHYGWATASLLNNADDEKRVREGYQSASSPDVKYQTLTEGIVWDYDGRATFATRFADWPHSVHWATIRAHRETQPAHLRAALADALEAQRAEDQRHWNTDHQISPNVWATNDPEIRARLTAELARHRAVEPQLRAAVKAATLAMLPLANDEPADLIEWAEAMA